ncbi:acyltransferase family protein [Vibrio rotiferianus]|uniref:acyltransferase family protein n=1 Tax=Vibrio rotiferianus TaxID=190895 RepID=UPI00406AA3B9
MNFRSDINGLRAIAVISVVLFHFNPEILPGGFAGVDVFFVISGFLMTSIIFRGLENSNFSIVNFYISRANRIIPALAILCLVIMIFGWFYLTPLDFKTLGKHVSGSIRFISNSMYLKESGYFDVSANSKWLLHTWSLSVEWQFYLIYPVVLTLLYKAFGLKTLRKILIAATVSFYLYSLYSSYSNPNASYFLLSNRAWEMLLGGIAYAYPIELKNSLKNFLSRCGLLLIAISFIVSSKSSLWPGYLALLPTIGTYLVIICNQNTLITSNYISNKLGLWSYSIYLWHWPLVVLGTYFAIQNWIWFGLPLSILLGYISHRYVESYKFPKLKEIKIKYVISAKPILFALAIFVISKGIVEADGIAFRVDDRVAKAEAATFDRNELTRSCFYGPETPIDAKPCVLGNKNNIQLIIVGDSHADAISSGILDAIDLQDGGAVTFLRHSCPFIFGAKLTDYSVDNCAAANEHTFNIIEREYPGIPVFVVNRTSSYLFGHSELVKIKKNASPGIYFSEIHQKLDAELLQEYSSHYEDTICSLSHNNPTYITTPIPEMLINVPQYVSRGILKNGGVIDVTLPIKTYNDRHGFIVGLMDRVSAKCGSTVLNVKEYLCDSEKCNGSQNGLPLYYDADHMTVSGSKLLTPLFKQAITNPS